MNWLDHGKTLREQSVDVNETLLLRRKYFFSDQNVDARDPVQLNLLYVQVFLYKFCLNVIFCLISYCCFQFSRLTFCFSAPTDSVGKHQS